MTGNLGADGQGDVLSQDLGVDNEVGLFRGFWKSVSDGSRVGDPPINHLILVPDSGQWTHTGESWLTAAIPMENRHCSCKLMTYSCNSYGESLLQL